jgi:hypothetical protein
MGLHVAESHVGGYYIVSLMSHFAECHVAGYYVSPSVILPYFIPASVIGYRIAAGCRVFAYHGAGYKVIRCVS